MTLLTPLQQAQATASGSPTTVALTPISSTASSATAGGLSFGDIVDALNPLQHIPVISGLYRASTGSSISTGSQIAGDTLYGAALGGGVLAFASSVATSAVNAVVKGITGEDISQHIIATAGAVTGSSASVTSAATPLVPIQTPAAPATPAPQTFIARYQHADRTTGEYQRAQMHDAINKKLVKMVI